MGQSLLSRMTLRPSGTHWSWSRGNRKPLWSGLLTMSTGRTP
jgi:hypothetical protein